MNEFFISIIGYALIGLILGTLKIPLTWEFWGIMIGVLIAQIGAFKAGKL